MVTAVLFFLYLAPEEATLGTGIRTVYIHVALTWTGMAGFVLAGLFGLAVLITANEKLEHWMKILGWTAYGFFVAGVAMSAIASHINWGGVFWQEPRMAAAFKSVAVVTIMLVLNVWIAQMRVRGLLLAVIPAAVAWIIYSAPLVLHPDNPIFSSEAISIQLAFIGLFFLCAAMATWIVWRFVK
ncbi:MAG: hypothetical protein CSA11_10135 [Chloroflexi bacterium]|nr:MAG: hypothetical protein CSB13_09880 [Chloroflexota bacterium]PIE79902.1 MAG: hypothetical protein CSA11_10135 [Chloroflexota bacterium]